MFVVLVIICGETNAEVKTKQQLLITGGTHGNHTHKAGHPGLSC